MPSRKISFSEECDAAAESLGGYALIDPSLEASWDALTRNPYEFPMVESDWFSGRYIVTKPIGSIPALCWWFVIQSGDITLVYVEPYQGY